MDLNLSIDWLSQFWNALINLPFVWRLLHAWRHMPCSHVCIKLYMHLSNSVSHPKTIMRNRNIITPSALSCYLQRHIWVLTEITDSSGKIDLLPLHNKCTRPTRSYITVNIHNTLLCQLVLHQETMQNCAKKLVDFRIISRLLWQLKCGYSCHWKAVMSTLTLMFITRQVESWT